MTFATREEYLTALTERLRSVFDTAGYPLPQATLRVACSFPSRMALSTTKRRVGECWDAGATADGSIHLLVSPVLEDVVDVAATLVHELCHAAVGTDAKHGPVFKKAALALGLTGKMTATVPSDALRADLTTLCAALGPYPHAAITPKALGAKKQSTRMLKVSCSQDDYILRGAKATLERGIPPCPICGETLSLEDKESADDDTDA